MKQGRKQLSMAACQSDTAVRMREVLARPWLGVRVPLAYFCLLHICVYIVSVYVGVYYSRLSMFNFK